jgi:hypothetical protein
VSPSEGLPGLSPELFASGVCSDERREVPTPDGESGDHSGTSRLARGQDVRSPRRRGCAGPGSPGDRESDASSSEKSIGCLLRVVILFQVV